jgi:hypothetical protein
MEIQNIFKKYGQKRVEYLQDHFSCFSDYELIEMLLEEMSDEKLAGYMKNVDELIDEDEEYDEFGVNTKNSFNTQTEA